MQAEAAEVTAIVLAWQDDPHLASCVMSLLASTGARVTVVLIDNGCTNVDLAALGQLDNVKLLTPHHNLGYASGCNLGAAAAQDDVLVFVNSDCTVAERTLATLADAALRLEGLVTASVRLSDQPDQLNSAGNPVHFLGFSWAGSMGQTAPRAEAERDVASVSGACFAVKRSVWTELGGFPDAYFAYHEDVELSLRCWLAGRTVRYVPQAIAYHHYEFSRNPEKMYLVERNRLLTWLTILQIRTLALLLPAMIIAEIGLLLVAAKHGWLRQKLRGWFWLVQHRDWIFDRRRYALKQRCRSDRDLAFVMSGIFNPGGGAMPPAAAYANMPLQIYWRVVRLLL